MKIRILLRMEFEWDENKNRLNREKHGVSFEEATEAFFDTDRFTKYDAAHSGDEPRYFCYGKTKSGRILTVRFTPRGAKLRIIGAGEWWKGEKIYEQKKQKNK